MIGVIFKFGTEVIEVRVEDVNVSFRTSQFGVAFAPIEGLQLNRLGVIKEFPDLEDNPEWRQEAIKRFKEKIKKLKTEKKRIDYIVEDLGKYGYKPVHMQRAGHRPVKL
jgi:hypothetical protein